MNGESAQKPGLMALVLTYNHKPRVFIYYMTLLVMKIQHEVMRGAGDRMRRGWIAAVFVGAALRGRP